MSEKPKSAKSNKKGVDGGPKAGVFIFPNKSRYEGEYREESGTPVRNGMGKFTCAVTGVVYHGEWNGDKMNGKGRLELTNGAVYTGNWKDGKYDGKGLYVWSDGSKYDGDWVSNRAHGSGTFIDTDEQIWIGQFAKGNGEALYNQLS